MDSMQLVREIVETVENGNLTDARSIIMDLPKKKAVVVVAYVVDHLHGLPNYAAFLRVLEKLL